MAFPRLNAASYWLYLVAGAGLLMVASLAVPGGAANSGWTSYPPLSVLATRGQDFWLVGILLIGTSSPGPDQTLGPTQPHPISASNPLGIDRTAPAASGGEPGKIGSGAAPGRSAASTVASG